MANEQEVNGKNEYFEYIESRILNLEKLILKKDEELKSLIINATASGNIQNNGDRDKFSLTSKGKFDQVFQDIKEEEVRFLKKEGPNAKYKTEELNQQLSNIEHREKMVQQMLDSLEVALSILKKRHEEVNRKEETLNQEYKKLIEIEALYQDVGKTDSLGSSLNKFSVNEGKKNLSFKNSKE